MIEEHEQLIVFMMIAGKQSGNGANSEGLLNMVINRPTQTELRLTLHLLSAKTVPQPQKLICAFAGASRQEQSTYFRRIVLSTM